MVILCMGFWIFSYILYIESKILYAIFQHSIHTICGWGIIMCIFIYKYDYSQTCYCGHSEIRAVLLGHYIIYHPYLFPPCRIDDQCIPAMFSGHSRGPRPPSAVPVHWHQQQGACHHGDGPALPQSAPQYFEGMEKLSIA